MSEEKIINEQDLEKVAGGAGGADFEQAWAAYASTHCERCAQVKYKFPDDDNMGLCDYGKMRAAEAWAAGQAIQCQAYIAPC